MGLVVAIPQNVLPHAPVDVALASRSTDWHIVAIDKGNYVVE
jgi:hypothetical protein